MTRFEELQNAYNQASESRQAYWSRINSATQHLARDFARYLGITPDQRVAVVNQGQTPALIIGWFNESHYFEPRPLANLPRHGNCQRFALRLVFGTDRSGEIPNEAVFKLSIKQGEEPDVFIVQWSEDREDPSYPGPSFEPLFKALTQTALEQIAPRN